MNGHSLERIIADVNQSTQGWFEYFKHAQGNVFRRLDQWTRMRLRSTLRWRNHGKGRGRGADHHRWPNVYFTDRGYFSLEAARVSYRQSPEG